jgi:TPP-dependent pyruvate/acetoin dehydrogenase alpha subunit
VADGGGVGYNPGGEVTAMAADLWHLYSWMLRSRLFEEATARLWTEGRISGELHLGTGEEAVIAGVVSHLRDGDAMALDHRGTSALIMRGADPALLLREMLGLPSGMCGGKGGHMHLFDRALLAASSGIVGAGAPAAAGFALAAQMLRPGSVAVALLGEGAMNQGMVLESLNLAAVWKLPVIFVCKDDGWSITTPSPSMTAGTLGDRATGLGVTAVDVDGLDAEAVWRASGEAIARARSGDGPTFFRARCVHLDAHFLGFPLTRLIDDPLGQAPGMIGPVARAFLSPRGAALAERWQGMKAIAQGVLATLRDPRRAAGNDPVSRLRARLSDGDRLNALEGEIEQEIGAVVDGVLSDVPA